MIKTLLLTVLFSVSLISFSQNYRPFPTNTASWKEWTDVTQNYQGAPAVTYTMNGDTIIGGLQYKKLFLQNSYYSGALRESSRIVYYYPDTASQEYVLYDFNLNLGDTVIHPFGGTACETHPDTSIVTSIGSITTNDGVHKTWTFNGGFYSWYEGIGSNYNLLQPHQNPCISQYGQQLEKMTTDSIVSYNIGLPPCIAYFTTTCDTITSTFNLSLAYNLSTMNNFLWDFGDGTTSTLATPTHVYAVSNLYNVCFSAYSTGGGIPEQCKYCHTIGFDSTGAVVRSGGFTLTTGIATEIAKEVKSEKINVFPNPTTGSLTIDFSEITQHADVRIFNITGELISKTTVLNSDKRKVDLSDKPAGMYFIMISNNGQLFKSKVVKN